MNKTKYGLVKFDNIYQKYMNNTYLSLKFFILRTITKVSCKIKNNAYKLKIQFREMRIAKYGYA